MYAKKLFVFLLIFISFFSIDYSAQAEDSDSVGIDISKVLYNKKVIIFKIDFGRRVDYIRLLNGKQEVDYFKIPHDGRTNKVFYQATPSKDINNFYVQGYNIELGLISQSSTIEIKNYDFIPQKPNLILKNSESGLNIISLDNSLSKATKIIVLSKGVNIFNLDVSSSPTIPKSVIKSDLGRLEFKLENAWGVSKPAFFDFIAANINEQNFLFVDKTNMELSFIKDKALYKSYPIAIGTPRTPTPVGYWVVGQIEQMPLPNTDWGSHRLKLFRLSNPNKWDGYAIHGTNRPDSIGKEASHGCVRMFNKDIFELYQEIKVGTIVLIKD